MNEVWGFFTNEGDGRQLEYQHGLFTTCEKAWEYAKANDMEGIEIDSIVINE